MTLDDFKQCLVQRERILFPKRGTVVKFDNIVYAERKPFLDWTKYSQSVDMNRKATTKCLPLIDPTKFVDDSAENWVDDTGGSVNVYAEIIEGVYNPGMFLTDEEYQKSGGITMRTKQTLRESYLDKIDDPNKLTKKGTLKSHNKDRLRCDVCGGLFTRNQRYRHVVTLRHKQAEKLHYITTCLFQKVREQEKEIAMSCGNRKALTDGL